MGEIVQRLVWVFVVTAAVAYASSLIAGSVVSAQIEAENPVMIRDELSPGAHRLSGMLMVPSSCYELSVRTEALGDSVYRLAFDTWQEPYVECSKDEVARAFSAILNAPATGITVVATVDGQGLPIMLLPAINGEYVTP